MNDKEGLNLLDFLATGINKDDPAIQAILSNFDGEGATSNEINKLIKFIDYYTKTDDVKNHKGESLEMIAKQFARLRRQIEESDDVLLRRMRALTERKGDQIWGNALDIKHVFEVYFGSINAYICENTSEDSLLQDGDFEQIDATDWTLGGDAEYTTDARFSERRGLHFSGALGASCLQTLLGISAGLYIFHFFIKGKCGVVIQNGSGRYWNADERILAWSTTPITNYFESEEWDDVFCFIRLQSETAQLKLKFVSVEGEPANIDYVRFYLKPLNPSYTIVVQYEGYAIDEAKTLHLGEGTVDPIPGMDYRRQSYFDKSYIIGRKGALQSLVYRFVLDTVRPRGIQPFVEFVEKTEVINDA